MKKIKYKLKFIHVKQNKAEKVNESTSWLGIAFLRFHEKKFNLVNTFTFFGKGVVAFQFNKQIQLFKDALCQKLSRILIDLFSD